MDQTHRRQAEAMPCPKLQGARLGHPGGNKAHWQASNKDREEGPEVRTLAVFLLLAIAPAFGQEPPQYRVIARNPVALPLSDRSTVPPNGRFEVVQSAISRSR